MLYEISECPGGTPDAYSAHYNGTMKLIELRGPEAHKTGLAHSVFQSLRVHNMFNSFVERSQTVLSNPEWCNVPFAGEKEYFDQLLDILLDIPGLYPQHNRIFNMRSPQEQLINALEAMYEGLKLESRLDEWYRNFKSTIAGPLYYPELSHGEYTVDNGQLGKLFPVAYQFPAFSVAQNVLFYWTALLSVHSHVGWMYKTLSHLTETLDLIRADLPCTCGVSDCLRHFTMDPFLHLRDKMNWPRTIAYDICQSIEYCLQHSTRGFGPISIMPVLAVVKGHWINWPGDYVREIAWIDEIFSNLGQERSIIAQFLK
ncbi:hypothetical protein TruAng_006957 [Truncatella angustata]|nr:hypothetical protein TruAng_006957 [Truncatella angustata]